MTTQSYDLFSHIKAYTMHSIQIENYFLKKEQISFDNSGISNTEVKKLSGLIFVYVFIYWFIEKPGMQKETVSHTCHCSIYGWIYARVARNGNIFRQVCFFYCQALGNLLLDEFFSLKLFDSQIWSKSCSDGKHCTVYWIKHSPVFCQRIQ